MNKFIQLTMLTPEQIAKVFVTNNQNSLEYTYVKNSVQLNGFECGAQKESNY